MKAPFPFSALAGQEEMKLALLLGAVNPQVRGILLTGEKGTGKSTAARALARLLEGPFVNLPLSTTEEALLGSLDLQAALAGKRRFQPGLLARAHGGLLYIDEVNLLPPALLALLLDVLETGRLVVEREGCSAVWEARFVLVGSMNPEEGLLPPQILDRFGLCVEVKAEKEAGLRKEIIKRHLAYERDPQAFLENYACQERALQARLARARKILPQVKVSKKLLSSMARLAQEALAPGHRAELALLEGVRAHAAWKGRAVALPEDLDVVAEMALRHRRRPAPPKRKKTPQQRLPEQSPSPKARKSVKAAERAQEGPSRPESPAQEDLERGFPQSSSGLGASPSSPKERLFPVGEVFAVREIPPPGKRLPWANRLGRGSQALTLTGRGHYLRPVPYQGEGELALYATLRAAALRKGPAEPLRIQREDLRAKLKVTKISRLLLFCVDGSGSMAAEARMKETKGAIMSLLVSAYQRRDQAALMVFRRREARLVLPPTSSVEFAGKILQGLTVGGSTPLSHALYQIRNFLAWRRRLPGQEEISVFLITDGRGNVSLTGRPPREEVEALARDLRQRFPQVQFVVVDTETGPIRLGLAQELATWLGAQYFTPEALRAERLLEIARALKESSF